MPIQQEATQLLGQVPYGAIIAAPLTAAVAAQAAAAQACVDFIRNTGVKDGVIESVTFKFKKATTTGFVDATIDVPVLSMLPIPFLRIDNLTIAMKTTINATTESSTTNASSNGLEGKLDGSIGYGPLKVGFSGGISSKKDSSATSVSKYSVEHTIDINIHATQDDMPAGLAKLLNILSDNIKVVTAT